MLLTDRQIHDAIYLTGELEISPFDYDEHLQPASVDIQLGPEISGYRKSTGALNPLLGVHPQDMWHLTLNARNKSVPLQPGEFILAHTLQTVRIGPTLACRIEGKSSLARMGLVVHSTAGFVDPGFQGQLTLEMTNLNSVPVILTLGMPIAQLSFMRLSEPVAHPYGSPRYRSHYQGQRGATAPRV